MDGPDVGYRHGYRDLDHPTIEIITNPDMVVVDIHREHEPAPRCRRIGIEQPEAGPGRLKEQGVLHLVRVGPGIPLPNRSGHGEAQSGGNHPVREDTLSRRQG